MKLTPSEVERLCAELTALVSHERRPDDPPAHRREREVLGQFKSGTWADPNSVTDIVKHVAQKFEGWFDPVFGADPFVEVPALRKEIQDVIEALRRAALENLK